MFKKQWIAALLLCALLPALLGGCFTVDVKILTEDGQALPLVVEGQGADAVDTQETAAAAQTPDAQTPDSGQGDVPAGNLATMSPAEQLSYFNIAVNRIKAEKAGFQKSKLTATEDISLSNSLANSVVGLVKGALLSENATETTVAKGESSDAVMSPYNVPYVSQLTTDDIKSIDVVPSGGGYIITVYVKGETNPELTGSISSRIFEFLTVDDVVNTYAPKVNAEVAREDIEVVYDGCFARATVDDSGRITEYETYVKATMILKNAKIRIISTDVTAVLASTTRYTNFIY